MILLGIQILFFFRKGDVCASFCGAILGGGFMMLGYLLKKGAMGAGDVKLMTVTGMYVGAENVLQVLLWSLIVAVFYGMGILMLKKQPQNQELPFAPFALLGVLFVWIQSLF